MNTHEVLTAGLATIILWFGCFFLYLTRVIFKGDINRLTFTLGSFLLFPLISLSIALIPKGIQQDFCQRLINVMLVIELGILPLACISQIIERKRRLKNACPLFFETVKQIINKKKRTLLVIKINGQERTFPLIHGAVECHKKYLFFRGKWGIEVIPNIYGILSQENGKFYFSPYISETYTKPARIFPSEELKTYLRGNEAGQTACTLLYQEDSNKLELKFTQNDGVSFEINM